jgi:Ni/Co efflux regulator RcnB
MKARFLTLTAVLLASVAQAALAQDNDHWRGGHDRGQSAPAPAATQPHNAPPAAPAQAPRPAPTAPPRWGGGGRGGGQTEVQPPPAPAPQVNAERPRWGGGGRGGQDWSGYHRYAPAPSSQAAPPDQRGERQGPPEAGRGGWRGGADQRRFEDRRPDDRRADGRWQGQPGDWDHDGRWGGERRRWEPHAYPPAYRSLHRYRGFEWSPPRDYYYRAWRFGEILPYGWYAPDYRILDWWNFDLPAPPPGYDWVRVGDDALLVEGETGRIVQVVRYVFW